MLILLKRGPINVNGYGNDMPQIFELVSATSTMAADMLSRKNSHKAYVVVLVP